MMYLGQNDSYIYLGDRIRQPNSKMEG